MNLKVFKVTGWSQYKTDCATNVERVQIAATAEEAVDQVMANSKLFGNDRTYRLSAIELL